MTDIVERLRSHLDVFRSYPKQTGADDMAGVVQSIGMAADEIEKLRVALRESSLREGLREDEVARLQAQVVALQSSLEVGKGTGKKTP